MLVALGSQALTLGRAGSPALIGRPLDLAIPVQMEGGETAASLCFEADVFHGDVRQDPGRVKVLVEPAAQPNLLNVRVVSATAVDEPVVTVYLRTGCGQKTTRRYVLLADFPSELAAPSVLFASPALVTPKAILVPVATASASASTGAADTASPAQVPKASRPQGTSENKRTAPKNIASAPKGVAAVKGVRPAALSAGQSRLQLDPLELLSDRVANLDGNMTFEAPPDALQSIQKIKTLEESLKSLRLLASKNEATLSELQARVQQAESSGFSRQAGYALIALALVCLAAMAVAVVLWRRKGQGQVNDEWWDNAGAVPAAPAEDKGAQEKADTVPAKMSSGPVLSQWPSSPRSRFMSGFGHSEGKPSGFGVDVNLTDMTDSAFKDFMPTGMKFGKGSKLADLQPAGVPAVQSARNLNSDAVLDIRQQAEFFVSLGQTERAAQLLRREIKESQEPNPLVYLDLLALFHSLGLKSEFQQLRESFELLFCCRIPAFTFFKNRSLDLESYPDVLTQLAGIWSEPGVFAWLENCIFQNPEKGGSPGFDLAAFRDLLFLHAVARILAETSVSEEGSKPKAVASVAAQPVAVRHAQPSFDALDLDLSSPAQVDEKDAKNSYSLDEPLPFLMPTDLQFDGKVKRP